MSLSEQRKKQFIAKKKRLLDKAIRKHGGSRAIFQDFSSAPSHAQLLQFLTEANYGEGEDNPVSLLGESVGNELFQDVLDHGFREALRIANDNPREDWFEKKDGHPLDEFLSEQFIGSTALYTELVYFSVSVAIEKRILPLLDADFLNNIEDDEQGDGKSCQFSPSSGLAVLGHYNGIGDLRETDTQPAQLSPLALRADRVIKFTLY